MDGFAVGSTTGNRVRSRTAARRETAKVFARTLVPLMAAAKIDIMPFTAEYDRHAQLFVNALQLSACDGIILLTSAPARRNPLKALMDRSGASRRCSNDRLVLLDDVINGILSRPDWREAAARLPLITVPTSRKDHTTWNVLLGAPPGGSEGAVLDRSVEDVLYRVICGQSAKVDAILFEDGDRRYYGNVFERRLFVPTVATESAHSKSDILGVATLANVRRIHHMASHYATVCTLALSPSVPGDDDGSGRRAEGGADSQGPPRALYKDQFGRGDGSALITSMTASFFSISLAGDGNGGPDGESCRTRGAEHHPDARRGTLSIQYMVAGERKGHQQMHLYRSLLSPSRSIYNAAHTKGISRIETMGAMIMHSPQGRCHADEPFLVVSSCINRCLPESAEAGADFVSFSPALSSTPHKRPSQRHAGLEGQQQAPRASLYLERMPNVLSFYAIPLCNNTS